MKERKKSVHSLIFLRNPQEQNPQAFTLKHTILLPCCRSFVFNMYTKNVTHIFTLYINLTNNINAKD